MKSGAKSFKEPQEPQESQKDCAEDQKLKIIRELTAENEYLKSEMQRMQSEHFRIHENLSVDARTLREALQALVSDLLPRATPAMLMRYNRPWQLAAQALYKIT